MMRLQRYLAKSGVASRRKCEEIISQGRVSVNGSVIDTMGFEVDEEKDEIRLDGAIVRPETEYTYWVLNKPRGVMTTMHDPEGRTCIADLLRGRTDKRLYPVGRLDYNTSGLILLTDDGDLANALMHPRHEIYKTYWVKCEGAVSDADMKRLCTGVVIDGRRTAPAKVRYLKTGPIFSTFQISIREGRNRQIRKMLDAVEHPVIALERVAEGPILLGDLREGQIREVTRDELKRLREMTGTGR